MGQIGPYLLFILPGSRMRGPRRIVDRRPAPVGVNGVEIERGAYDVPPSRYFTDSTHPSRINALFAIYQFEQLIGEDVTVVDEDGTNWPNVTVLDVQAGEPEANALIINPLTGGDTWVVSAQWSLQLPYTTVRNGSITG